MKIGLTINGKRVRLTKLGKQVFAAVGTVMAIITLVGVFTFGTADALEKEPVNVKELDIPVTSVMHDNMVDEMRSQGYNVNNYGEIIE